MSKTQRDIVARLREPMLYFGYGDRVIAAAEIERLRAKADLACAALEKQDRLLEEARKSAVAAEREAILDLIESKRADYANVYFGDYCLRTVAAAIRARGEQQ